jgi:hypothetical protein
MAERDEGDVKKRYFFSPLICEDTRAIRKVTSGQLLTKLAMRKEYCHV